jgi:hypothetical protein
LKLIAKTLKLNKETLDQALFFSMKIFIVVLARTRQKSFFAYLSFWTAYCIIPKGAWKIE